MRSQKKLYWERLSEGEPLGTPRRRWEDNIRMNLQEAELRACSRLSLVRIRTGGGLM
jgi:hypothetical protein